MRASMFLFVFVPLFVLGCSSALPRPPAASAPTLPRVEVNLPSGWVRVPPETVCAGGKCRLKDPNKTVLVKESAEAAVVIEAHPAEGFSAERSLREYAGTIRKNGASVQPPEFIADCGGFFVWQGNHDGKNYIGLVVARFADDRRNLGVVIVGRWLKGSTSDILPEFKEIDLSIRVR